jgi:capsular exopolysaccharide synthesis family protein
VVPRMPHTRESHPSLMTARLPMSLAAEAYRSIRTALLLALPGNKSRSVLVTSPAPGEGKSTAASNLAISLAQAGYSTVLIEADLRKPVLGGVYAANGGGNLNQLLRNELDLKQAIRNTDVPGLEVLACSGSHHGAAEIIAGSDFRTLIQRLKEKYQYVVMDSSPVCSVSDARVLATMCDVTLVVVRARQSSRRQAVRAVEELVSTGARVLGLIVNDVKQSARRQFTEFGGYYYTPASVPPAVPTVALLQ